MDHDDLSKKNGILLFCIVLFCDFVFIGYLLSKKEMYFVDERWQFSLSNSDINTFGVDTNPFLEHWKTQKDFNRLFIPTQNDRFNYHRIQEHLSHDVHAPLSFYLLHTICSFFPDKLYIWIPISFNLISFILIMVFLYKSCLCLSNRKVALCSVLIYSISLASFQLVTYIRMYEMLSCICIMIFYYHLKLIKSLNSETSEHSSHLKQNVRRYLDKISFLYFIGYLTHYSMLVVAVFLSLATFVLIIYKTKQFKGLGLKYSLYSCCPFLLSFIAYPDSFKYRFTSDSNYGKFVLSKTLDISLTERFTQFLSELNQTLHLKYFLIASIISIIIFLAKRYLKLTCTQKTKDFQTYELHLNHKVPGINLHIDYRLESFLLLAFVFVCSYLCIIKLCFLVDIRYLWLIVPIIYILASYIIRSKSTIIVFLVFASLAFIGNVRPSNVRWLYGKTDAVKYIQEHPDQDVVVYYKNNNWCLFEYFAGYFMDVSRVYSTLDMDKHIDTKTSKVTVVFSRQFLSENKDVPDDIYIQKAKQTLGFKNAIHKGNDFHGTVWEFNNERL